MTEAMAGWVKGETLEVPNSNGVEPPATPVPAGATDCHHHIFDLRFPKLTGKPMRAVGTADDYQRLKRRLGLSRSVVVAPASYGDDNACLLDALDRLGDAARGVAIAAPGVSDRELDALHARRVRGIRLYLEKGVPPTGEEMLTLGRRLADRGWHIEIMPSRAEKLMAAEDVLARLACRVVIDHLGYIPQPGGETHPGFATLVRLIGRGNTYVKLSGVYFTSKTGYPGYADVDPLARELVRTAPERMLWGTDWPHSGEKTKPDDAKLLDQLARWAPDDGVRRRVLVDNPAQLYWSA